MMSVIQTTHTTALEAELIESTLTSPTCSVTILNYGGIISKFVLTTVEGEKLDVLLGFDDPLQYIEAGRKDGYPYFGAIIGRSCNRTAKGRFSLNNGQKYSLAINNKPNSLHGGIKGFDKKFFTPTIISQNPPKLSLSLISPDMDEGYPGKISLTVEYSLLGNELIIDTFAELIDEKVLETYINLTCHPYFNLSGGKEPNVTKHTVRMTSKSCLELDDNQIPTGNLLDYDTKPEYYFDTNKKDLVSVLPLVQQFKGFDHYYLLDNGPECAVVECPRSKVTLHVSSSASGFQFYTGNWLDGSIESKKGQACSRYSQYGGFCVEPSEPPDAINSPFYKSKVIVTKQTPHKQRVSYRLDSK